MNSWKRTLKRKLLRYTNVCTHRMAVCTCRIALLSKRKEVFLETQRHCAWWQSKLQMIPLIPCDSKGCNVSKLCRVSKQQLTESNWVFTRKQGPGQWVTVKGCEDEHWGERSVLILDVGWSHVSYIATTLPNYAGKWVNLIACKFFLNKTCQ
jgi:hypothetical protein